MIYTGHLPASGDSFCLGGAIVQRPSPYVQARVWPLVFSGNLSPSTAANSQLSCTREIYEPSIRDRELRDTTEATVSAGTSCKGEEGRTQR